MISFKKLSSLHLFSIVLICIMLIGLFHTSFIFIRLFFYGSVESIFYSIYWAPIFLLQCLSFGASIILLLSALIKQKRLQPRIFNPIKILFFR